MNSESATNVTRPAGTITVNALAELSGYDRRIVKRVLDEYLMQPVCSDGTGDHYNAAEAIRNLISYARDQAFQRLAGKANRTA